MLSAGLFGFFLTDTTPSQPEAMGGQRPVHRLMSNPFSVGQEYSSFTWTGKYCNWYSCWPCPWHYCIFDTCRLDLWNGPDGLATVCLCVSQGLQASSGDMIRGRRTGADGAGNFSPKTGHWDYSCPKNVRETERSDDDSSPLTNAMETDCGRHERDRPSGCEPWQAWLRWDSPDDGGRWLSL